MEQKHEHGFCECEKVCNFCHKRGHWRRDCYTFKNRSKPEATVNPKLAMCVGPVPERMLDTLSSLSFSPPPPATSTCCALDSPDDDGSPAGLAPKLVVALLFLHILLCPLLFNFFFPIASQRLPFACGVFDPF